MKQFLEQLGILRKLPTTSPTIQKINIPLALSQMEENDTYTNEFLDVQNLHEGEQDEQEEEEKRFSFIISPKNNSRVELADKLFAAAKNNDNNNCPTTAAAIYKKMGLLPNGAGTIFIVDSFTNALPDETTAADRRKIVQRVLNAAGTSLEALVDDGLQRIEVLDKFWQKFKKDSNDICGKHAQEICENEDAIEQLKREISAQNHLMDKQELLIEEELEKIKKIIAFITQR